MKAPFWSGWILFSAIMMGLIGAFDVLQGIAAISSDGFYALAEDELVAVDLSVWGWVTLIWGLVLLASGYGLIRGREWARWAGLAVAGLSAALHAFFLSAAPVWTVIVLCLLALVIVALAVRWDEAQADMSGPV